jgi:MFS family permease
VPHRRLLRPRRERADAAPPVRAAAGIAPLWRNREFVLLEAARLLSSLGDRISYIAYPLLVLELTSSPAKAGVVGFARLIPTLGFGLLAGVAADRYDRKRLMLGAHVVRALVLGTLAAAIVADEARFWLIAVAAFVQGLGSTVFGAAEAGATKAVVPRTQLPTAIGAMEARISTVQLLGPPVGGVLFGIGRSLPFVAHSLSYAFSLLSLVLMRTPFQEERERDAASVGRQIAEGFRFLWREPFLRTCAFLYGLGNFSIPGLLLVLIVVAERNGFSPGEVGLLLALFAAATLVGALLSPFVRRTLSARTILLLEFWTGIGSIAFLVVPNVFVLLAALTVQGVVLPVTNSVVDGYRLAITPDRLVGRVGTVASQIELAIAPLGPLAAGLLLSTTSPRITVACILVFSASLVVWGMSSAALRNAPDIRDVPLDAA